MYAYVCMHGPVYIPDMYVYVCMHGSSNDLYQTENGSEWAQATMSNNQARITPRNINKNMMPDVTGMGLKDAVYLLENNGLQVQVEGYGKVKTQSIPAGTTLIRGSKVIIKLG